MNAPTDTVSLAGLQVIFSNRVEDLGAALAELLRATDPLNPQDALQPEIVLVQSKGMQRWVSLQIARHNGICANLSFPFPNAFLDDLYARSIGPVPQRSPYEPSALAFRIQKLLPPLLEQPAFSELSRYFHAHPLKAYELTCKIADLFDQYMIYRPEMLAAWESGRIAGSDWQGLLWQAIKRDIGLPHRAELQQELIRRLRGTSILTEALPPRVSVFGISHLPPFHLNVLNALAERIPVYVFASNPCRQFWFDIVSDYQLTRIQAEPSEHDLHFERGNRLLSSWGRMGLQFFSMLHESEPQVIELYSEDRECTLLKRIQKDVLDLVDRPPGTRVDCPPDRTIRIQCCHSAMREVEVLHDQLLSLFETYDDLTPGDIMVMTPDINAYAPFIHAVFGASQLLPFSVADQALRRQSRAIEAFLELLSVNGSRFEAEQIIALLEFDVIRERFGIEASDLPIIEEWIRQANIRWGWDGRDRKKLSLPGFSENSWRAGLDRLLLGYAMLPDGARLFDTLLPAEPIEGSQSRVLGSLAIFAESLHESVRAMPREETLQSWSILLSAWIDRFFKADSASAPDIQLLRNIIGGLSDLADASGYDRKVPFEVVQRHVRQGLERITLGSGFMVGGVTFCAMLPMRSIPAKIICILGLQHDAFPQDAYEPKFNLLAAAPRLGDRSKRNDDKYLFLEALLSARRVFYLSYIGRGIQDNAVVPPSVLVDELVEYVCENYTVTQAQLVTVHPLQAFSPVYFDRRNADLFSYSQENLAASRKTGVPGTRRVFFDKDLPEPDPDWRNMEIRRFVEFFGHPVRFLLERRLGIRLHAAENEIARREAFNLDPLGRFLVEQKVLKALMSGRTLQDSYAALRASGVLPHGAPGKELFERIASDSATFADRIRKLTGNESPHTMPVHIRLDGYEISGEIGPIFSAGAVMFRTGKIRTKDLLAAFLNHLLVNRDAGRLQPVHSFLLDKETIWQFGAISDPDALLRNYVSFYWHGLKRPLRFFPQSSYAFAEHCLVKQMPVPKAMQAARSKWRVGDYGGGEAEDPYFSWVFNEDEALTAEFQDVALALLQPLFENRRLPDA